MYTNDNVRRVANHSSSATNVGENGLADQVRARIDSYQLTQLASQGRNEKNSRHIVEEGRQNGSHDAQQEKELRLVSLSKFAGKHTSPLENACAHGDANDEHHTPEEP